MKIISNREYSQLLTDSKNLNNVKAVCVESNTSDSTPLWDQFLKGMVALCDGNLEQCRAHLQEANRIKTKEQSNPSSGS